MIQAIDLSRLRNSEFIQFSYNFTSLVNTNNATTLAVKPQYDAMLLRTTELDNLFKNEQSNPITAEIEALDMRRDQAITGLMAVVNGFTYHFDSTVSTPAKALQKNLDLYGAGVSRENYQSETAIINSIISDWASKPVLSAAITKLNLSNWTSELRTANQLFNEKYLARTQDYAIASPDTQKSKRAEVMLAYYDLRKFLDANSVVKNSPAYVKTMNELNALIEQYNTLLNGRTTEEETNPEKPASN